MNVLITGGHGFIGSNVAKLFQKHNKYKTILLDNSPGDDKDNSNFLQMDIRDKIPNAPYDKVIHCAGLLGTETLFKNPLMAESVNVIGTINLLECQKSHGFIYQPSVTGKWHNPYMASKRHAEEYGLMFREWYGTKYVSVRITDVYGPGQSISQKKAVPSFIISALKNEPITIYGDGSYIMKLIFVSDVASVLFKMADIEYNESGIVNICSLKEENNINLIDLAHMILDISGSKSEVRFCKMRIGQPANAQRETVNYEEIEAIMNLLHVEEMPLEAGLQKTIKHYEALI